MKAEKPMRFYTVTMERTETVRTTVRALASSPAKARRRAKELGRACTEPGDEPKQQGEMDGDWNWVRGNRIRILGIEDDGEP